mmetsp:Transcript_21724/g.56412  ORF Transcript_21724/g.56412 Transcript_21724/m.56412 type:complete len:238 (-) Transcript_21724:560-1273(-)
MDFELDGNATSAVTTAELMANIGCPIASYLIVATYLFVVLRVEHRGKRAYRTTNAMVLGAQRGFAFDMHMQGNGAINTIRNAINASRFFAKIAITLSMGVAGFAAATQGQCGSGFAYCSTRQYMLFVKEMVVAIHFFLVFFFFSHSVRFHLHAELLLGTTKLRGKKVTGDEIFKMMRSGTLNWTIGLRGYYFIVPLLLWIISPWANLASSVLLLFLFYTLDHLPSSRFSKSSYYSPR